jgi:hypothetical protein
MTSQEIFSASSAFSAFLPLWLTQSDLPGNSSQGARILADCVAETRHPHPDYPPPPFKNQVNGEVMIIRAYPRHLRFRFLFV